MNEPLVECKGITKVYKTAAEELEILSGIDLVIDAGSSVSIMGASGSGKSTFLSILGGLDIASGGSARVGKYDLVSLSERGLTDYRATVVGFVFQFHYLLKDFSALENVALPAYMRGEPRKKAFKRAEYLLSEMGLGERLRHYPSQLSGGERQRAAIARALVNQPSLVLADEPTGNLDAANADSVKELLFGLSSRLGTTLVIVTHDPTMSALTERNYILASGRLTQK